jgi:hypothetical protein
LRFSLN